jgi:molybdopterin converting factor small subunit
MKIRVKMFAMLRERGGASEIELELPAEATVADAISMIGGRFPGIANLLPRAATAVNLVVADGGTVLWEGDELAVLPPVSGG